MFVVTDDKGTVVVTAQSKGQAFRCWLLLLWCVAKADSNVQIIGVKRWHKLKYKIYYHC